MYDGYSSNSQGVFARIKEALSGREIEALERFGFEVVGGRNGREIRFKNTNRGGDSGSCSFNTTTGLMCDHADAGFNGDLIAVVAAVNSCSPIEAVKLIADALGIDIGIDANRSGSRAGRQYDRTARPHSGPAHTPPETAAREAERDAAHARKAADEAAEDAKKKAAAQKLWDEAEPFAGSLAANYLVTTRLADRDIEVGHDQLRFHPGLEYRSEASGKWESYGLHPCLLAPLRNARTGELTGVLRTYLRAHPDGTVDKFRIPHPTSPGKFLDAKKVTGRVESSSWLFGKPSNRLLICEGGEDGCSLSWAMSGAFVMAASSAGQIGKAALPLGVGTVIVVPDDNKPGEAALRRAVETYGALGVKVLVARLPPGQDSNSLLLSYKDHAQGDAALKACVDAAVPFIDGEADAPQAAPSPVSDEAEASSNNDAPKPPADLLEIPGAYGALGKYLRDRDDYSDSVKAFMLATTGARWSMVPFISKWTIDGRSLK